MPRVWLPARLAGRARQKVGPAVRCWSSFIPLRLRNVPKYRYSRLHGTGLFVFVVAEPIQDLSAVSITDKTVGIGLPRLRYGAIV
jgi:hypothetical protein